ncbi:hypothetical protein WICPIJ_007724 [Wickerhamomyces pijperi]|uniref:Uncharacterized protein n=1 Tax=Wickerhamomyces pijperi TaxID=599730 RepID=A0A9P8Q000_WICPI|nr:hypothetical protein WICPIJ_007724 [Wickerhamomyces pijperi]
MTNLLPKVKTKLIVGCSGSSAPSTAAAVPSGVDFSDSSSLISFTITINLITSLVAGVAFICVMRAKMISTGGMATSLSAGLHCKIEGERSS